MIQENKTPQEQNSNPKQKRGFAAMSPEKRRSIASKGGIAVQQQGKAHQFNSEEARVAGRKGGMIVSQDRRYMAEIGKKGGQRTALRQHSKLGSNDFNEKI